MNLISHIVEPTRLNLVWQAPEGSPRDRRVVAELRRMPEAVVLRYLRDTADFVQAHKNGFIGHPAFKLRKVEHREKVMDTFIRRLPPRSRSDFGKYLARLRLPTGARISDFALLGYSEAKLPGDGFSILNDFFDVVGPCEFLTEIAGFRHYGGMKMQVNDLVGRSAVFRPESTNPYDVKAVRVELNDNLVGYVNRVQAPAFLKWIGNAQIVKATVDRINGTARRPQVYLFVSVEPQGNS